MGWGASVRGVGAASDFEADGGRTTVRPLLLSSDVDMLGACSSASMIGYGFVASTNTVHSIPFFDFWRPNEK